MMYELIAYIDGPVTIAVVLFLVLIWRRYVEVARAKDDLYKIVLDAFQQNTQALVELRAAIEAQR